MPFLGFPILMYFPSGLCIYWATVSAMHLTSTLALRVGFVKRFFGVDGYLPGSILYKQHVRTETVKVKAVFADHSKGVLNSAVNSNITMEVQKANEKINAVSSNESAGNSQKVEVF